MMCVGYTIYTQRLYSTCIIIVVIVENTTSAKLMGEYEKLITGTVKKCTVYTCNIHIHVCTYMIITMHIHVHVHM